MNDNCFNDPGQTVGGIDIGVTAILAPGRAPLPVAPATSICGAVARRVFQILG